MKVTCTVWMRGKDRDNINVLPIHIKNIVRLFFITMIVGVLLAQESLPKCDPDIAEVCLALCTIQEPEVNVEALRNALVNLENKTRARLEGAIEPAEKVRRINEIILNERQVSYISNKYWRDSTLAASLLRGHGNCLSTTTLYAAIGQRIGVPIQAVIIPRHAFARYDDGKVRINIETTSHGSSVSDEEYHSRYTWPNIETRILGYGQSLSAQRFASFLYRGASSHLVQTNRFKEALELLDKAISLWPENPNYQMDRLITLYKGMGRRQEALQGYEYLLQNTESLEVKTHVYMALADHLQSNTRHEEALALLYGAYHEAPKYIQPSVLSEMATSYRALRRFNEALVVQELSVTLDGDAEDFTNLAILYKNASKINDAIRCLKVSLEKNPESWNTRLILAGYLLRAGKTVEGWEIFKTVEKPRVDEDFYETNMAWFYGSIGKKKEFLEHLDKALSLSQTPHILDYINTEVDFDQYRKDPEFRALVERHLKRLMNGK